MTTQTEAERLADALEHMHLHAPAAELRRLVSFNQQLMDEVSEQCRINGMSAEREDALRAEVERLNKAVAGDRDAVTAAPIIEQLVAALESSGTPMRSDQWYVEIEAVAAGKFYLNSVKEKNHE